MPQRHYTIPVFIPEEACPNRCVFCNQRRISGSACAPSVDEVKAGIEKHLSTIPHGSEVEIGFFGGNFTGIPVSEQKTYLETVQHWIQSGRVSGIRISTRPDYISAESLALLQSYHVKTIELGAQSLDDEVLRLSGRGHSRADVVSASRLIRENDFSLGLQMMTGLPGDTPEKTLETAREIIRLGAACTRIYPTLVIRNTELETLYLKGLYQPLSLEEAVNRCADIIPLFVHSGVRILRTGLHPSEGLLDGSSLVAGPFHVNFGEMVYSEVWHRIFQDFLNETPLTTKEKNLVLCVAQGMRNAAFGYQALNRALLLTGFRTVTIQEDSELKNFEFHADLR
jgi:histone acetyltransferase (RNA polymerase elongator complex component)